MSDPYQVLGVSPSATDEEVKAAYRKMAKRYHPDRNGGSVEAEKKMMQVNDAYSQIMDMRKNGGAPRNQAYQGGYGGAGQAQSAAPELNAVRQYLSMGQYMQAMQLLENMADRSAEWYYLYARVRQGLGDDIAALNCARQAVNMEPLNGEYRAFLEQLTYGSQEYRQQSVKFGGMENICRNPCVMCMLFNCCCGGRGFYCIPC